MVEKKQFLEILKRQRLGKASAEELDFLSAYYNLFELEPDVLNALRDEEREAIKTRMATRLDLAISKGTQRKRLVPIWLRIASLAAAVAAIVFGIWFYTGSPFAKHNPQTAFQNDVGPGKNTATLTLANGKTLSLSDAKTGLVVKGSKHATQFSYTDGTALAASGDDATGTDRKNQLLTAQTPRGGTYQFTLPDGSRVWLNAESKISFPAQFSGTSRKILLSGEAYFEVAHTVPATPFIVESSKQQVSVLGTHFNINAYPDEGNTRTTLLTGSVKVNTTILSPGQQSILADGKVTVKETDPELAIDWKNGQFIFDREPLPGILRKVARWYNVTIIYANTDKNQTTFSGVVSRSDHVSSVLRMLQKTSKIKFSISGNTVTVE